LRQHHRQLIVGHRHVAALLAVNQRNRTSPVALARYAPVAQAPLHALPPAPPRWGRGGVPIARPPRVEAGETARVDQYAGLAIRVLPLLAAPLVGAGRGLHHSADRDAMTVREFEVALIMCRHAHHRALAV